MEVKEIKLTDLHTAKFIEEKIKEVSETVGIGG